MSKNRSFNLFTESQWSSIQEILNPLDSYQSLWLSGYLAAKSHATPNAESKTENPKILIAYGSETGNSESLARQLDSQARDNGMQVEIANLAYVRLRQLNKYQYLLIICSTHGDGEPPESITSFYKSLMNDQVPAFQDLNYAVLSLGDSSYEHFCTTGRQLDERFSALGATRLLPRVDCDVDFSTPAQQWMSAVLSTLQNSISTSSQPPTTHKQDIFTYNKQQPLIAEVLENICLTAEKRRDPIHHIELAIDTAGFDIRPGDAIGLLADNPPALVAAILNLTRLSGEQPVTVNGRAIPLVQALREARDLTIPGQRFLEMWADLSCNSALRNVLTTDPKNQRDFLRGYQVIDLISHYPGNPDAQMLVDNLRPLQPRLYDVANSPNMINDELHLTVKQHRYSFLSREELGVASDYLLHIQPGDSVRIYPHANPRFRMPENMHSPLILIADSTGVAPYRAFIQEMKSTGRTRPCWLIFSEHLFEEDFLYQLDWQQAQKEGILERMDTVFLQDQPRRSLADPLIDEAERLTTWLENDGHLYLCGDKDRLTKCEHTIKLWFEEIAHKPEVWQQLNNNKRIHRNLY